WQVAEASFVGAERWEDAAQVASELANLSEGSERAEVLAREGEHWLRAGRSDAAVAAFERALEADPAHETSAKKLEELYDAEGRTQDLVQSLLQRASRLADAAQRVALRKRAAALQSSKLGD